MSVRRSVDCVCACCLLFFAHSIRSLCAIMNWATASVRLSSNCRQILDILRLLSADTIHSDLNRQFSKPLISIRSRVSFHTFLLFLFFVRSFSAFQLFRFVAASFEQRSIFVYVCLSWIGRPHSIDSMKML